MFNNITVRLLINSTRTATLQRSSG